ncbi:MAG: TIR domain-containing protein [Clostridia bacterium]|nr:TIR domain-containing protein [Clostridia bacterium]
MKNKYVFISYSTENIKEAELVREVLSDKGILCWMAPHSIPFGSNYSTEIFDAISDCFVFVLLLSKESMSSDFVSKELDLAVSNHKYILPVNLDGENQTNSFKFYLCNVQVIPIDNSLKQTAERLADFIISRNDTTKGKTIRLAQKYEKPAVSIHFEAEVLERLDQLFSINNVVCISGMGGMGKSALAKSYIKSLMDNNKLDVVSYNSCPGSISQAISMIPLEGLDDEEIIDEGAESKSTEDVMSILYQKKLSLLKNLRRETILVFDGLNVLDYEGLESLDQLDCRVLITTRYHFDDYPELRMEDIMSFENQKALFLQYYEDFSGSEEDTRYINKIIEVTGGHVLTIKLIALYLNATGMLPKELYERLFSKGSVILNTNEKIAYKHSYQTIDEHISELFQMTELSSEEMRIMQELSFVPNFGISKRQFRLWTPEGTMTFVDQLVKRGWVQNNKGIIGLHPIIHSMTKEKRPKQLEELSGYFASIISYLDIKSLDSIPQRQNAALLAEYLADEIKESSLLTCKLYLAIGRYLNDYAYWLLFGARNTYQFTHFTQAYNKDEKFLEQFSLAESTLKKGISVCNEIKCGNRNGIQARLYSNLGATYYNMRHFDDAVLCHQKALALRTEELGEAHFETLTSRRRLGASYLEIEQYDAAFTCYHRNLELLIDKKADAAEISKANYDCGKVFLYKKDTEPALPYLLRAIQELEKAAPDKVDSLGAAELYYVTAKVMSDANKTNKNDSQETASALLSKAKGYTDKLDSAASDELKDLILQLGQQKNSCG